MRSLGYTVHDAWENAEQRYGVAFAPELDLDPYHGMASRLEAARPPEQK